MARRWKQTSYLFQVRIFRLWQYTPGQLLAQLSLSLSPGHNDLISPRTQATLECLTPHYYFHTFPEGIV